jgi:hypothetical protein
VSLFQSANAMTPNMVQMREIDVFLPKCHFKERI